MKKFSLKVISGLFVSGFLTVSSVNAFAQSGGVLVEVGSSKEASSVQPLKGFANDLPLITVMKQVTPNGWIVKKNDSPENRLDVQKPVSWEGGKSWTETLKGISEKYGINMLINWNEKTITLSNAVATKVAEKPKGIFELEGSAVAAEPVVKEEKKEIKDVAVGVSEQPVAPVKQVYVAATAESWLISSSKSLKQNVSEWASKAGYRLVWIGEDYPVSNDRVLSGTFEDESGPIKQLSLDYGPDSRVQNPLSFVFYQNRTLVVENWTFEQTGYPQFNKKDTVAE